MKMTEIKELKTDEIKKKIQEEEDNLVDLRFSLELKQLSNTAKIKATRKDIARLKTVLRQRELEEFQVQKNAAKSGE